MNQNLTYTTYTSDPRGGGSSNAQPSALPFHPTFHPTSTYTTSTTFHGNTSSFIPNSAGEYKIPGTSSVASSQNTSGMRLATPAESDDRRIAALLDSYFIETPGNNWGPPGGQSSSTTTTTQAQPAMSSSYSSQVDPTALLTKKSLASMSPEKRDKERFKRQKQAEAARLRYHRLSQEEKKDLNMKRTLAQKRKRQREKEMEELESILRESNDIQEDPEVTDQLRERRMRAKWAEAARARYQRMSSEERRAHNNKRRMRQMQNAIAATKEGGTSSSFLQETGLTPTGDPTKDEEAIRAHIKMQNQKKAEAARQRYHRMTDEEKRIYNQRRTEAFRRRRMEEEMLLAMPIGRINGEALDRAQQIVVRNAKRAEAARLRYQRMTPDQRKSYNQKRYTPKRKRIDNGETSSGDHSANRSSSALLPVHAMTGSTPLLPQKKTPDEEVDALTTLERDVLKRTQQAQAQLARRQYMTIPTTPQGSLHSNVPSGQAPSLIHTMQQQQPQMGYANSNNQGIISSSTHMQPIMNPYGNRP